MSLIKTLNRRNFVKNSAVLAASASLPLGIGACTQGGGLTAGADGEQWITTATGKMRSRAIPGTNEYLPVVGLGAPDMFFKIPEEGKELPMSLVKTMMEQGGRVIDAPAFFREDKDPVLGELLTEMKLQDDLFLTGKVSAKGKDAGIAHLDRIVSYLDKNPLDLLMVHNMREVETHWPTLKQLKAEGKVRYIGVSRTRTTDFTELEAFLRAEKPDFLLIGYSITQQVPAERILPLAADLGIAVIGVEAFKATDDGAFFKVVSGKELPEWTSEFDCETWAQFSLKWILSNPALTTVVVETSKVKHVIDNMRGGYGRLPDQAMRKEMSDYLLAMGA